MSILYRSVQHSLADESDQAGLILISRFLRFPYEKFLDELHSSTESCDTSATFFEVCNVLGSAEVKFSTSETKPTSSFIFYLGNLDERSSSSAGPAAFFCFHRI